ncbi:MAG TPA: hypothetical protein PLO89_02455 [Spirochaetota bacterium]|nr:hypothetical protein [Spirochaetota bacterium]
MIKKNIFIFIIIAFSLYTTFSQGAGGNSTGGNGGSSGSSGNTNPNSGTEISNKPTNPTDNRLSPNSRTVDIKKSIIKDKIKDSKNANQTINYKKGDLSNLRETFLNEVDNGKNKSIEIQKNCSLLLKTIKTKKSDSEITKNIERLKLNIRLFITENENFIQNMNSDDKKTLKRQIDNINLSINKINIELVNLEKSKTNDNEKLLKVSKNFQTEANVIERQYRAIEWIMFEE